MTTTELIAKAEENNKWVGHNYERLIKEYNDKWVAVLDMQVIDSDKDLQTLVSRLRKKLDGKYPRLRSSTYPRNQSTWFLWSKVRLNGYFREGPLEAAYITVLISLPELQLKQTVDLLIDTGATKTTILDKDARREKLQ